MRKIYAIALAVFMLMSVPAFAGFNGWYLGKYKIVKDNVVDLGSITVESVHMSHGRARWNPSMGHASVTAAVRGKDTNGDFFKVQVSMNRKDIVPTTDTVDETTFTAEATVRMTGETTVKEDVTVSYDKTTMELSIEGSNFDLEGISPYKCVGVGC